MDDKKKVIDKIRKLLQLANSDNIHEAHSAIMAAQRIALKNDLKLDSIGEGDSDVIDDVVNGNYRRSIPIFERKIAGNLSVNFRVMATQHIIPVENDGSYVIMKVIGLPQDVKIFKQVYKYTVAAYKRFLPVFVKKYKERYLIRTVRQAAKNDYMYGFLVGLNKKFEKNIQEYGLVVVLPEEVKKFADKTNVGKDRSRKVQTDKNRYSFTEGHNDALGLTPHRTLEDRHYEKA